MSAETDDPTVEYRPNVDATLRRAMVAESVSSSEYAIEDVTAHGGTENVLALWHTIRDSGVLKPDYQQTSSARLTPEERLEIWQMCLKRFQPQSGVLPSEPVLLYWRLGNGEGNWVVTLVTGTRNSSGRPLLNFDSLLFTAPEWDKVDANPFALLISGAFDLIERVGVNGSHPIIPLSLHELRAVPMTTESATPLPSIGKGYHVEYPERSLSMLRQWFSWLSKIERRQYFFASWWSDTAQEKAPKEIFLITFTDRKVVTPSESLADFARRVAADLSKAIATLPVESNIRYPALGYAIGEMGTAANLLHMALNPPSGWQGDDAWTLKRQAFTALHNAQTHAETYVKARGDGSELDTVLRELGVLNATLADDLRNAPVVPPAPAPVSAPAASPVPAAPVDPTPAPAPSMGNAAPATPSMPAAPSTHEADTIAAPIGKQGRRPGLPNILSGSKIVGEESASPRRLSQNYPQTLEMAPHRNSKTGYVVIGALVVLSALVMASFLINPELLGNGGNAKAKHSKNAIGDGGNSSNAHAATPGTKLTIQLNPKGAIWTGTITASNPQDIAQLRKLMPGARIQTWNDLNQKVFLTIGAKPLVKDNVAKFGIIYRFHPDAQSPADGTEVKIVAKKSDTFTQAIANRPTTHAADRFANQIAIYLSKGLRANDVTGFDPQVIATAQKLRQDTMAKVSK